MAEYQKKSTNSLWHSPLMLFVLFCVVLLFMYNMIELIEKVRDTNKKTELVHSQIDELSKREQALNSDISRLKTDQGVEETLRDKYQLVKTGEKMVVIVDEKDAVSSVVTEEKSGNSFVNFFKGIFQ